MIILNLMEDTSDHTMQALGPSTLAYDVINFNFVISLI